MLATLIGLLGDFDVAEECLQEACAAALQQWPSQEAPANPRAWLISAARHKAIDRFRRNRRLEQKSEEILKTSGYSIPPENYSQDDMFPDDRLRLIFTCCHPALDQDAQVALTLRTLCGLTTEEISRAFLVPVATMAQRLVRVKRKIRETALPYRVPLPEDLPERLAAVLLVVYLIFNEGYLASSGDSLIRRELCGEAIRLGRLLCQLLPKEPGARALLALMLLHDSRRDARVNKDGELILLEEQDRSLWHWEQIQEGSALLESALRAGSSHEYALEAAIAALHANAKTPQETDWRQIAALYDALLEVRPSPIIEVNRAAAIAMAGDLDKGLELLDGLERRNELANFHLLPAARADLLRRLGRLAEAADAYRRALSLTTNDVERRFLARRLASLSA